MEQLHKYFIFLEQVRTEFEKKFPLSEVLEDYSEPVCVSVKMSAGLGHIEWTACHVGMPLVAVC